MKSATKANAHSEGVTYSVVPNIAHPELTAMDLLVWGALCSFARWEWDGEKKPTRGTCNPGRGALARRALCTVRTVSKAIKDLEELGFISRKRTTKGGGFGKNEYTLTPVPESRESHSLGNDIPYTESREPRSLGTTFPKVGNDVPYTRELRSLQVGNDVPTNKISNKTIEQEGGTILAPAPDALTNSDLQEPPNPELITPPEEEEPSIPNDETDTGHEEEAPVTVSEIDKLFSKFWLTYSTYNPQGEIEAKTLFRKMLTGKSLNEVSRIVQDMTRKLNDATLRWEDGGAVNKKYVPAFANWLRRNHE